MKLKNKISLLIAGTLLSLAGLNLILDSDATRSIGAILALTGVLTNIIVLVLLMKQEKWLHEDYEA
ncbi:hypothetical protein [Dyadobacter sp. LHD-138]|uniref:hypothetical protein n=1 Tax=Dyadobacter sp. LHD-138 TaxID=3071413 RepID=UPI0027DFBEB9|nr:hypothetical protein [Dyadobacter sp. LHD-138]MDQ6482553.1 hypothetical protein [Dyadobacter sp. LHD-138]